MKRALLVLALVSGCDKGRPAAAPAPAPRAPDAGAAAAAIPDAAPAGLTIERGRVMVGARAIPDRDGGVDVAALEDALAGRTGALVLAIAPDAPYLRLVDVLGVTGELGLAVALDTGGGVTSTAGGTSPVMGDPDRPTLVLTVTNDAIYLAGSRIAALAELPAGDDIPALREALAARPVMPDVLALQADRATSGAVLVRVISTARRAGVAHVLFAVQTGTAAPPPPP